MPSLITIIYILYLDSIAILIVRAANFTNPVAKDLLNLMDSKQTNLCIAADVTLKADLLLLADVLGYYSIFYTSKTIFKLFLPCRSCREIFCIVFLPPITFNLKSTPVPTFAA